MYVVTFYSYKGGVGRTMGLINVAADLVRRGRKVLLVDFDLEAPGLTSQNFCENGDTYPGIVDYISEYIKDLVAPDAKNYISKCKFNKDSSPFWLMSSGRQDGGYGSKFHSINWKTLYEEQSGYLMMEDLKEQWKQSISPDYVLIDSRTGHTDVGGICTRQLPDAVAIMFIPNGQNLPGLRTVVSDIRAEKITRKKDIRLHFISSNTPDVDDEMGVLRRNSKKFSTELDYKNSNVVHHYNDLALLDETIFTLVRPQSRLAQEYAAVSIEIMKGNPADREGALAYLSDVRDKAREREELIDFNSTDDHLAKIAELHSGNAEIFAKLGGVYFFLGRTKASLAAYENSLRLGSKDNEVYRYLSILSRQLGRVADAQKYSHHILESELAKPIDVFWAVRTLVELNSQEREISCLPAVRQLSVREKLALAEELRTKGEFIPAALALIEQVLEGAEGDEARYARNSKVLCQIGLGRYRDAMEVIGSREDVLSSDSERRLFNYAMAEWGDTHKSPLDLFSKLLEVSDGRADEHSDPNYLQCLSIAHWQLQQPDMAENLARLAMNKVVNAPGVLFSAWRFINVEPHEFRQDLQDLISYKNNTSVSPPVFHWDDWIPVADR